MFAKLGAWCDRWRWAIIGGWLAVTLAGAVFGGALFDRLQTVEASRPDSESASAQRRIDRLAPEGALVIAVVQGRDVYDPGLVSNVTKISREIAGLDGVVEVDDLYTGPGGQIGSDNQSTTVRVELEPGLADDRRERLEDDVRARLHEIEAPSVLVTGTKLAERAFAQQSVDDLVVGESVAFAVLLVALVVIFGGVVAASLPLAVAITAVSGTLLALLAISGARTVSEYSLNVVSLLGIGLAVDYSLLIVARYREERVSKDHPDALAMAAARAGVAVCVSGLAVAAALGGLAAFAEPLLAAVALGGAGVVVLATASALTLVPALLAVAKNKIRPAGVQTAVSLAVARLPFPRSVLSKLATAAQRRPAGVALGCVAVLLALAAPLLTANFANSDARALPRDNEVRQAFDVLQAKFNNSNAAPVTVLIEADPGRADVRLFLNELLRNQDLVFRLELRRDVPAGATIVDVTPKGTTSGAQARELVRTIRQLPAPFPKRVAGETAEVIDYQDSLASRLPLAALIVLAAMVVLLFALTGSLVIPLKALVLNVLTLLATLGVLVAVFQWGLGEIPLAFDSWGAVDLTTPILLFVFVFGLSMDYEVFLLARIKEEFIRTGDGDRAVLLGITRSGPVVTAAAACIVIVFAGFAAGGLVAVKEIGVGMAVAVLLDVTVVRGLLLPAVMTMLDDWNWWAPGPLRRWYQWLGGTVVQRPAQRRRAGAGRAPRVRTGVG